jgi:hypothetical protein
MPVVQEGAIRAASAHDHPDTILAIIVLDRG